MDWQMDIQMAPCPNDPKFYQMCGSALVSHPKQEPQTFCGEYICKYNDIDGRYDIYQVTGYKRCHYLKYDQCIANNTMNECNFTSRILLLSCFFLIRPFHFQGRSFTSNELRTDAKLKICDGQQNCLNTALDEVGCTVNEDLITLLSGNLLMETMNDY